MSYLKTLDDKATAQLEKLIILNEGFKKYPYDDATGARVKAPKGNLTWLCGINLDSEGSMELATLFLRWKLGKIEESLKQASEAFNSIRAYNAYRLIAILDIAYNTGVPKLLTFDNMWANIKRDNWVGAAGEMKDSLWAKQVGERATRDEQMMLNNEWCNI
jgi:lysozyme